MQGITIQSSDALARARAVGWPVTEEEGRHCVQAPGGYKFYLEDEAEARGRDPVRSVAVAVSNMQRSLGYWEGLLGMQPTSYQADTTTLSYSPATQASLVLVAQQAVEHGTAPGRIAFSVPSKELPGIQEKVQEAKETILTPLVSLDTPGKATVQVVILADPDGQEICFVGAEAFRELSQVDPNAATLLDEAIANDKSDEWFAKKGREKVTA